MAKNKPVRIEELVNRKRTISIDLPDIGPISVTYSPYGAKLEHEWMEIDANEEEGRIQKLSRQLATIITAWEIEDSDGVMVPPTYEILSSLDFQIVNVIFKGIVADMLPPTKPEETSAGG